MLLTSSPEDRLTRFYQVLPGRLLECEAHDGLHLVVQTDLDGAIHVQHDLEPSPSGYGVVRRLPPLGVAPPRDLSRNRRRPRTSSGSLPPVCILRRRIVGHLGGLSLLRLLVPRRGEHEVVIIVQLDLVLNAPIGVESSGPWGA